MFPRELKTSSIFYIYGKKTPTFMSWMNCTLNIHLGNFGIYVEDDVTAEKQDFIISGYHVAELIKSKLGKVVMSLDLGITSTELTKLDNGVVFPDGQKIASELLKKTNKKRHPEDCFLVQDNSLLYLYSFENNRIYKLYEPHMDWPPTLWINGSVMHTISVSKPTEEAENKVKALGNIHGDILDTCFGLGYTAIELIKRGADSISTFEISQSVIEIAEANPWSKMAFDNSKIRLKNSDIYEVIKTFKNEEFDMVLHDPPNIKIEGDLYSLTFYKELYRILKKGGTMYHFVGGGRISREYKVNYLAGVTNRLFNAGFKKVQKSYRGVLAIK